MTAIKALPFNDVPKADPEDERFYSVTTILGVLDKPALLYWSAEQTALAAVAVAKSLPARIQEEGEEAIVKWLRDARFRQPKGRRSATELGTAVHDACEEYALTGVKPKVDAEVQPFLDRFDEWVTRWQPVYEAAEMTVYSPTYGYSGTLDAVATIDGVRFLLDYKSTAKDVDSQGKPSKPYPEQVGLQLAAYRHAELAATWRVRRHEQFRRRYYLLNEAEKSAAVPVPEVDAGLVVHITPQRCTAYPINCGEQAFESFLYVQEAFRWVQDISKTVMGTPLGGGK